MNRNLSPYEVRIGCAGAEAFKLIHCEDRGTMDALERACLKYGLSSRAVNTEVWAIKDAIEAITIAKPNGTKASKLKKSITRVLKSKERAKKC